MPETAKTKSVIGRPSKYTPETVKIITDAVGIGVPIQVACGLAGIDNSNFFRWVKAHPDFRDAIKTAAAKSETRLIGLIGKAAAKNWTAAAWILERHPKTRERWAKRNMESGPPTSSTILPAPPEVEKREPDGDTS